MTDVSTAYKRGLAELLKRLDEDYARYAEALSDEELSFLYYDFFRDAIQRLIAYYIDHLQVVALLERLTQANPTQFSRFEEQLMSSDWFVDRR
jgi:hypothetical protein